MSLSALPFSFLKSYFVEGFHFSHYHSTLFLFRDGLRKFGAFRHIFFGKGIGHILKSHSTVFLRSYGISMLITLLLAVILCLIDYIFPFR